jgi:hypothetical protein
MEIKMNERVGRKLTLEERAELHRMALRIVYEMCLRPKKPTLVCRDGEVVTEVNVEVSPSDPNWQGGEVRVRK